MAFHVFSPSSFKESEDGHSYRSSRRRCHRLPALLSRFPFVVGRVFLAEVLTKFTEVACGLFEKVLVQKGFLSP